MPADPEQPATPRSPATPAGLVADAAREVGFLDAPTLDAEELADAVGAALGTLAVQAVLTVYSARVSVPSFALLCGADGLDLLAAIEHEGGGTTFTLRRDPLAQDQPARGVAADPAPDVSGAPAPCRRQR